jgi:hypothetical protein
MDLGGFLRSTPPEINWKIEAWNDARITKTADDYASVSLLRTAVASLFDKDTKFPSLKEFCPEAAKKIEEEQAKRPPPVDEQLENAMDIARQLGHI